jgi:hypothetical protein
MMRPPPALAALPAVLVLLVACGRARAPIPPEDLFVDLRTDADVVAPGEPFGVTVRLVWSKKLQAPAWKDDLLSPLVVRLESSTRREDDSHVEEVLRYRAYLFTLDDAKVGPILLATHPPLSSVRVVAQSQEVRLGVVGEVDEREPGAPELPLPLSTERSSVLPWGLLAVLLLFGGGWALLLRRRAPLPLSPAAPSSPFADLFERLEALRRAVPSDPDEADAQVGLLSDLLRSYLVRRFDVSAFEKTSEEIVAALAAGSRAGDGVRARLSEELAAQDRVKFARVPVDESARLRRIDGLEALVRETSS